MDVRQLEYFCAVTEELNVTRAAARCHVAQSALSYQIARLEREHGVSLFERTSRSVRVTAAGELLFHRARAVLDELDSARAELAELAGVITGRLRLGMVGSTGQAAPVVERTLVAFHQRHPAVEISIRDTGSRHMAEQVRAGELDIAFVEMRAESGLRQQVDAVFARPASPGESPSSCPPRMPSSASSLSASARRWSPARRPPPGLTTSPSWSSPTPRPGTRSASSTVTPRRQHPAPAPSWPLLAAFRMQL